MEVVGHSGNQRAQSAMRPVLRLLQGFNQEQATLRLAMRGVAASALEAMHVEERDLADAATRAAQLGTLGVRLQAASPAHLQSLLRERVSIRDLAAILEGVGEEGAHAALSVGARHQHDGEVAVGPAQVLQQGPGILEALEADPAFAGVEVPRQWWGRSTSSSLPRNTWTTAWNTALKLWR